MLILQLIKYRFFKYSLSLKALIIVLLFLPKPASAQQYNYNYDSLERIINLRPDDTGSIRAYVDYASKFFYIKGNRGINYLDKAAALSRQKSDNYLYLYCLKNKGDYYILAGDFKAASKIYQQAIHLPSGPKSWLLKIKLKCNLATAYKNMGTLDSAQYLFEDVMKDFYAHPKSHGDSIAMAFSFIQLFDVYKAQGLIDEALYYGQKANELSLALKFERGIGYGWYIQAFKYQNADPQLALVYCDKALAKAVDKKMPDLEQFVSALKAKLFIHQKKYREAELLMLKTARFTSGSAQQVTCGKLAEIYDHLGNLPKALSYFKQSYHLAKTSGYRIELAEILQIGITIYGHLKSYKTAFKLEQEYLQVQQAITTDKLKLDYQRSVVKFKTAEKDKLLVQKQLQIAQKNNQLDRQSFYTMVSALTIILVVTLWALHIRQQRKMQLQRSLAAEAAKGFQALEAMMKGEELERQRIAKDLHDGIGGLLSAIKMTFSAIKNQYPELTHSDAFKNAITMLNNASADVRRTAHNLMPDMLARLGLEEAVRLFCDQISQRNELVVDYQSIGTIERYDENFELTIYRIVLELISNIIRHAHARAVLVQFTRHDELLTISVEDDGIGFDVRKELKAGLGLSSITERVQYLRGFLEINSDEGQGTGVYMEFDVSKVLRSIVAV